MNLVAHKAMKHLHTLEAGAGEDYQLTVSIHQESRIMELTQTPSAEQLDTFPNPKPGRDYSIEIICPEFTSVCPLTGQPDFGTITYIYTPNEKCVELKSLKLYLQRFRNQGIYYEQVTNRLLDDFVAASQPVRCTVVSRWTPRGGITTNVTVTYAAGSSKPAT